MNNTLDIKLFGSLLKRVCKKMCDYLLIIITQSAIDNDSKITTIIDDPLTIVSEETKHAVYLGCLIKATLSVSSS